MYAIRSYYADDQTDRIDLGHGVGLQVDQHPARLLLARRGEIDTHHQVGRRHAAGVGLEQPAADAALDKEVGDIRHQSYNFV